MLANSIGTPGDGAARHSARTRPDSRHAQADNAASGMTLVVGMLAAALAFGLCLAAASTALGSETKRSGTENPVVAKLEPARKSELTRHLVRVKGRIGKNVFKTGTARGVPEPIMQEMVKMLGYVVDFQRDLKPANGYEVVYELYMDPAGKVVRTGHLVYAGLSLDARKFGVWRFTPKGGKPDYFSSDGKSVRTGLLRTPVDGARVSSGFGMRKHPILGYSRMHKGIDFAVPTGTPIFAAGDGKIEEARFERGYGNYVRIRHDNGVKTVYAHLAKIGKGIKPGVAVKQGQIVAYSGSTGLSTGPHLHYEVHRDDTAIDPASIEGQPRVTLAGAALQRFRWQAAIMQMKPALELREIKQAKPRNASARDKH